MSDIQALKTFVWVVIECNEDYAGDTLLGVFRSPETAEAFMEGAYILSDSGQRCMVKNWEMFEGELV